MMMLSHSIPKLHSTIYKSAEKNNILLSKHFISRQVYMHFAYKKMFLHTLIILCKQVLSNSRALREE